MTSSPGVKAAFRKIHHAVRWGKALLASVCAALCVSAMAADGGFPDRPIRMIVPYAVGGVSDIAARIIGQRLTERLGKAVLVENKLGAAGAVGLAQVTAAPADGYTIGFISTGYAWLSAMYPNLPINPEKDFAGLAFIANSPYVLVARADAPYKTVPEFIRYAKANRGKISYATGGIGTLQHLFGEWMQSEAGIEMTNIPYNGSSLVMNSLLADQVHVIFDPAATTAVMIKAGKVRALATTGTARTEQMPDVPTLLESGVPVQGTLWLGMVVRSGVPPAIINLLNREINAILLEPEIKQRLAGMEMYVDAMSAPKYDAFLKSEIKTWGTIVRDKNIKAGQ